MIFLNLFDRLIKQKDVYFKFSTDEQWTGEYWLDGKKIYTKTIEDTQANFINGVNHGISNIGSYRTVDFNNSFWKVSDSMIYQLGNYESSVAFITPKYISNTIIKIAVGSSWNGGSLAITIRYTKTTD